MQDDLLFQQLSEAISKDEQMPAEEWFADMVRRGILDENGNVLKRMPEPPPGYEKRRRQQVEEYDSAMRDPLYEQLREAIRKQEEMPAEEWFADMVRRGILDANGNVLKRMPEPPKKATKPKKAKKQPKPKPEEGQE